MKTLTKILVLVMAMLALTAFAACGGDGGNGGNGNGGNGTTWTKQQSDDDIAMLKSHGYNCESYFTNYLDGFEAALKAESGSLKAYLFTYNDDGNAAYIYYFKTESNAKKCYDQLDSETKPSYKLKNNRLLLNDTTGLFD